MWLCKNSADLSCPFLVAVSQVMKALNEKRAKRDHLKEQALPLWSQSDCRECWFCGGRVTALNCGGLSMRPIVAN